MEMATRPNLISGVIFDAQTAWSFGDPNGKHMEAWKHAGCLIMIDYVGTCGNQLMLRQTDVLPFGFLRVRKMGPTGLANCRC